MTTYSDGFMPLERIARAAGLLRTLIESRCRRSRAFATALAVLVVIACGQIAVAQGLSRQATVAAADEHTVAAQQRDESEGHWQGSDFFSQSLHVKAEPGTVAVIESQPQVVSAEQPDGTECFEVFDPTAECHKIAGLASVDLAAVFDPLLSPNPPARPSLSGPAWRCDESAATQDYYWEARNLVHRPLYFQDVLLERHGFTHGQLVQPIKSGLRFFGDYLVWPFRIVQQPCHQRQSVLGLDRPGS